LALLAETQALNQTQLVALALIKPGNITGQLPNTTSRLLKSRINYLHYSYSIA